MTPHQSNRAFEVLLRMRRVKPERRPPSNPKAPQAERYAEWRIRRMAENLGSSYEEITGPSHKHSISRKRAIIAYHLRVECGMTLQAVANVLGKRNHATIFNAVTRYEGFVEIGDREFLEMIKNSRL